MPAIVVAVKDVAMPEAIGKLGRHVNPVGLVKLLVAHPQRRRGQHKHAAVERSTDIRQRGARLGFHSLAV
jgi:hypothetical protein